MTKLTNAFLRVFLTTVILFTGLASTTAVAYAAEGDLEITVAEVTVGLCGQVSFEFAWENGTGNDLYSMDFGNGDTTGIIEISESTITIPYEYLPQGDYHWTFTINDVSVSETLTVEGPKVTLKSEPFPAILIAGVTDSVEFTATVDCGLGNYLGDYTYKWDLNGDGTFDGDTGNTAIGTYTYTDTEVNKYYPLVEVTDHNLIDYTTSDTMPVVVADPEVVCHPMAQKISDGVNTIFPDKSGDLYTCDDIYALFDNVTEENNLGFGQMWKAYHLAESMEELTWEDILDWKLNESGWGTLLQLDRFADLLGDYPLPDLMGMVMSEDYSLGDVRTAVRSVTRYDADFEDTLARILDGANTGDINQAYKLATDDMSATDILDMGVQSYRESLRDEDKVARELLRDEDKAARELLREENKTEQGQEAATQQEEPSNKTAEKLAEQYSAEFGDVMNLLNGECEGDWACVRKALRNQEQEMAEGDSDRDLQTALQIGSKYGYSDVEVLAYHNEFCDSDWACTRTYFREHTLFIKETGKPDKK